MPALDKRVDSAGKKILLDGCAATHAPPTEPHRRLGTAFHSAHPSMDQRRENPMARGRVSMERRQTSSPKPKKVQAQRSAGKLMLTLFWDHNGPILEHYMPRGSTLTSATYSNLLREIWSQLFARSGAGCWRRECVSSTKMQGHILLQQQCKTLRSCGLNAPHTLHAHPTSRDRIYTSLVHWRMRWVESSSETTMRFGRRCMSGCAPVQKNFFPRGIYALVKRWHKCIELAGDYVEQW